MGRRVGAAHPDGTIARYYYFFRRQRNTPLEPTFAAFRNKIRPTGQKLRRADGRGSGGKT